MIYIAYFILIFTGIQFLIAFLNFVFRADYGFFSTSDNKLISVIIPVRNEAANIENLLHDLTRQSYRNIEVFVVDDDSEDNTKELVINRSVADNRIKLLDAGLPDHTWLGKNHACYQGAKAAKGKFFLFLDADVRLKPEALKSILGYFEKKRTIFLSVFPKQILVSSGVKKVIPLMNYILLGLLPLFLVRLSGFSSLSAANGQFMLFDSDIYKSFDPHKRFKHEKVEDIKIARFLKKKKLKIACLTGNDDISCKMYDDYSGAMEGFTKNVAGFFGGSFAVASAFWFITLTGILWTTILLPWFYTLIYIMMVAGIRIFISITSKQKILDNLLFHYVQIFNLGRLIFRSIKHKKNKSYQWKGRNIS